MQVGKSDIDSRYVVSVVSVFVTYGIAFYSYLMLVRKQDTALLITIHVLYYCVPVSLTQIAGIKRPTAYVSISEMSFTFLFFLLFSHFHGLPSRPIFCSLPSAVESFVDL